MRKKNLKFSALISPSRFYLHAVVALHTLASITSLCIDVSASQHLILLAAIAGSLSYQINCYAQHTRLLQMSFEGTAATCRCAKMVYFPAGIYPLARHTPIADVEEYYGELLPKVWVLPKLIIIYMQIKEGSRKSLIIFRDSVSANDFRKLKIFVLNGPLLRNKKSKDI